MPRNRVMIALNGLLNLDIRKDDPFNPSRYQFIERWSTLAQSRGRWLEWPADDSCWERKKSKDNLNELTEGEPRTQ
jgi:hypothetical protein